MMTLQQIEEEMMDLDLQTRARLANKLLDSLEELSEEENLQLWIDESERRLGELRTGKAHAIPASEVFESLRAELKCSL